MVYPENFELKIGFDRIRELVEKKCLSDLGQKFTDTIHFSADFDEIHSWLNETSEFKLIHREEEFPVGYITDISGPLEKIKTEGAHLEIADAFNLRKSLDTVRNILNFFKKTKTDKYPFLSAIAGEVKYFPFIATRIDKVLTKTGKVKDNASKELLRIRQEATRKNADVSKVLNKILKAAQQDGFIEQDVTLSIRNGRPVIPVGANYKRKIRGIIHDESATGKTSYVEPTEVVEINNEIKELEYAEKREIIKILIELTNDIRPYSDDLLLSNEFLGKMDMIRAKALVAMDLGGVLPGLKDKPVISWNEAIHPLLLLAHRKENREVVPLTISLDDRQRILLISGPNAGGKSVCLKTVGLLQYMLQSGLLVPMEENSAAGIFDKIFIDIGDEQSIENDLSTYSSHLVNMKYFTRNANEKTLLLIDEFGTGTEPILGGAIAEAILDRLNGSKTFGIITTHYSNLKHFASANEGIENGAMLFDTQKMKPLFRLEIGQPGSSFAFEIARNIGLPANIIEGATNRVGEDQIQFDKHLRDIIRDKRYWETKRDNIRKAEKKLQHILEQYSRELESAESERKEIMKKAKKEAEDLLAETNRKIENTIREIREAQAEKQKTRQIREKFQEFRDEAGSDEMAMDELREKVRKIKQETSKVRERRRRFGQLEKTSTAPKKILDPTIKTGDFVFLKGQEMPGEVLGRKGNKVTVRFGQITSKVDVDKLEKTTPEVFADANYSPDQKGDFNDWDVGTRKLYFKPEIDVRGKRAEEALREVTELIDEAVLVDAREVRILHGKGDGILRQVIREMLATMDVVGSFKDEHIQLGGAGITVVQINI